MTVQSSSSMPVPSPPEYPAWRENFDGYDAEGSVFVVDGERYSGHTERSCLS
jgi:hypothetical protein